MQFRSWTPPPVDLPEDARRALKQAFREANRLTTRQLSISPNRYETDLDGTLITSLGGFSQRHFPSGVVVTIEAIFVGGGGRAGPERGDIALVVQYLRNGTLLQSKLGLVQSKRLFAQQVPLQGSPFPTAQYTFNDRSRYEQLLIGRDQYTRIAQEEQARGIPIYYLLYNPWQIPWTVQLPLMGVTEPRGRMGVGCRIVPSSALRNAVDHLGTGSAPSYDDITRGLPLNFQRAETVGGWRLEDFVLEVLDCREGAVADQAVAELIETFRGRERAHSSAVIVSVDQIAPMPQIT